MIHSEDPKQSSVASNAKLCAGYFCSGKRDKQLGTVCVC
jgi:hypothetical protein